ncbi:MAG: hypothetical protein ACREE7_17410, partial [Dongiaceae bacterium]
AAQPRSAATLPPASQSISRKSGGTQPRAAREPARANAGSCEPPIFETAAATAVAELDESAEAAAPEAMLAVGTERMEGVSDETAVDSSIDAESASDASSLEAVALDSSCQPGCGEAGPIADPLDDAADAQAVWREDVEPLVEQAEPAAQMQADEQLEDDAPVAQRRPGAVAGETSADPDEALALELQAALDQAAAGDAAAMRHAHDSALHYKIKCPACEGALVMQEGCQHCLTCGWTAC